MKVTLSGQLHLLRPVGLLGCLRLARVDDARGQISGQVRSGSVVGSVSGCISDSALNPKSARGAKGFWYIRSSCLDSWSYAKNHWMSDCVWPVGDVTFKCPVLSSPLRTKLDVVTVTLLTWLKLKDTRSRSSWFFAGQAAAGSPLLGRHHQIPWWAVDCLIQAFIDAVLLKSPVEVR